MTFQNRWIGFWFIPPSFPMNHQDSFSIESSVFTGSIVPIASWLMVRSEFYNGALNEICSWANLLSLYWLEALTFFLFSMNRFISDNYVWICIDALLHCLLWYDSKTLHIGIIYHLYSFFSFFRLSIYLHPFPLMYIFLFFFLFCFAWQLIRFLVYAKKFSCCNDRTKISYLDCFFGSR